MFEGLCLPVVGMLQLSVGYLTVVVACVFLGGWVVILLDAPN